MQWMWIQRHIFSQFALSRNETHDCGVFRNSETKKQKIILFLSFRSCWEFILTQQTQNHHRLLWPHQLPFDRWPFHTGHVLQDRRVSSHYSRGQEKNQARTEMDEQQPSALRVCLFGMVSGATPGQVWDCHQLIRSIIFRARAQIWWSADTKTRIMAAFWGRLWKDNGWKAQRFTTWQQGSMRRATMAIDTWNASLLSNKRKKFTWRNILLLFKHLASMFH